MIDKKESSDGLYFHYNREDRLSREGATDLAKRKGGILRGNRSLTILLLDILLLLLIAFVVIGLFQRSSHKGKLEGYALTLSALAYQDAAYVTLTLESLKAAAEPPRVFVKFYLSGSDEELFVSDVLPVKEGGEIVLKGSLPLFGDEEEILAEVKIGDKSTVLKKSLSALN